MATANIAARASRQERFRSPQTMPLDAGHARPGRPRRLLDFPAEARSPASPRAARCRPTVRERAPQTIRPVITKTLTSDQVWWLPRRQQGHDAHPSTLPQDDDNAPPGPLLRCIDFPAATRWAEPERLRRVPSADNAPPGPLLRCIDFPAATRWAEPERLRRVPSAAFSRAPSSIAPEPEGLRRAPSAASATGRTLAVCGLDKDSVERVFYSHRICRDGV